MILFRPVYPGWIECISPQEFLSGALMFLAIAWHAFKKSPPIRDRLEWDVMVMTMNTGQKHEDSNYDSETESESEDYEHTYAMEATQYLQQSAARSRSTNTDKGPEECFMEVQGAVTDLLSVELSCIVDEPETHEIILRASNTILGFLDCIASSITCASAEMQTHILTDMGTLLSYAFMDRLFVFRDIFHQIAISELKSSQASSTVAVCWVDTILSKLSRALLYVLGHNPQSDATSLETLTKHQEEISLRAALQLPQKWENVPCSICSPNVAPAAARLALHLTFAVYVVGPQLGAHDPWTDSKLHGSQLLSILKEHVQNLHHCQDNEDVSIQTGSTMDGDARIEYAMIVVLFASIEFGQDSSPYSFRPHTEAALLSLIRRVVQLTHPLSSTDVISPPSTVDIASSILVLMSSAIFWTWTIWDDHRIADSETIDYLSCVWLHHLARHGIQLQETNWEDQLSAVIDNAPVIAGTQFTRIFRHFLTCLQTSDAAGHSSSRVMLRLCWGSVEILRAMPSDLHKSHRPMVQELCKSLCYLFVMIGDTADELQVKDIIFESLSLVEADTYRPIFLDAAKDMKLSMSIKMDEKLTRLTRRVRVTPTTLTPDDLILARQMLLFLTLSWHHGVTTITHRQTISSFLLALIDWLSSETSGTKCVLLLLDPLVTALAVVESFRLNPDFKGINKLWDDDTVWRMCLRSDPSDLTVAAAFAAYAAVTAQHRLCGSFTQIDAWDYFRDIFLLMFRQHFLDADEALALFIVPSVCRALRELLLHLDFAATQFIQGSPWSLNLIQSLKILADRSQDDEFGSLLNARTKPYVFELMQLIQTPESRQNTVKQSSGHISEMVFCRLEDGPHLFLADTVSIGV